MSKTYGEIKYNARRQCWNIECQPHVAIQLKRVFQRISVHEYGVHHLSITPENSFNLKWFLQRWPMTVVQQDMLDESAARWVERESLIEQILATQGVPQQFLMKLPPREYQAQATAMWLAAGGLLLADDVGLGKTAMAIAGFTDPRTRPALVVTLTHLPHQWKDEVAKFTDLDCHILRKASPYDITKYHKGRFPDVIISNYHKLSGWAETLAPLIKSVTFDEVQELRHQGTGKYKAASHLAHNTDFRLGLSATPIYNYGGEIYNVINVLLPDVLGDEQEFKREWCVWDEMKPKIKDPKAFGVYAREAGLMLRRTRKEVKRELPDITVVPHYIDANPEVIMAMESNAIDLAKLILAQTEAFKGQKMKAAGEFDMKMRQATGIAKAPFVAEFVKFLVQDNDEPVVLYGWHREVYRIWMEKLKDLNPVMYTGSESSTEKEESKRKFLAGESKVFIISLRAGAGLDGLQKVCHVGVFGELDWSPGVHEQCGGRIHRDGQDDPVTLYYLISEQGSDPIISDVLGVKKQQIEGLRDPNQDLVTKLQVEQDYIKKLAEKFLAERGVVVPFSTGG